MTLSNGMRLGPYEILDPIGAGGMGEVYKAKDTRLERTVAIKVLPSHLSASSELRQRFEQEARTVSSLNHPNICTLHDIGAQDGVDFLVMEYIEGETLADRLEKGPLPLDQSLRHAVEIADAIDQAHRHGVVHRDLKPGNIMLTKSGAKLLDFGLAKLQQTGSSGEPDLSALATEAKPLTQKGSILGTFQYMAPEQLEGKEADARSDLFAFGAVLHEMLTGRKAFEGKSQASLISAIMSSEPPPVSKLESVAPAALDRLVQGCLVKDPDLRRQSAYDLKLDLEWIAGGGEGDVAQSPRLTGKKGGRGVAVIAAAVVGAIVAGLIAWSVKPTEVPQPVARFALPLSLDQRFTSQGRQVVALSPDGTYLVYVANQALYLRKLDELEGRVIRGTEGTGISTPFFSADGKWLGFYLDGSLKKIPSSGGAPVTLCEAQNPSGASWGPDGMVLFGQGREGIFRASGSPGKAERLIEMEEDDIAHGPQMLPDGKTVLFTLSNGDWDDARIVAQSLDTGERHVLIGRGRDARYLPSGYMVFGRDNNLLALPFDARKLELKGEPVSVVEEVWQPPASGTVPFSVSENGTLVYVPAGSGVPEGSLVRVGRNGESQPLSAKTGAYLVPRPSPDGRRLAVVQYSRDNPRDIWILEPERDAWNRLTFHSGMDTQPLWTPDGRFITFSSTRAGGRQIYSVPTDGAGEAELIPVGDETAIHPASWSPDGKGLAFHVLRSGTGFDIGILDVEEEKPTFFLETTFDEAQPAFSPDGRYIAYTSNETGRPEIFVRPYPGPGSKVPISTDGGWSPLWSPTGGEIFYRSADKMMAIPVKTRPSFTAGRPIFLFEGQFRNSNGLLANVPEYSVTKDGQGFVMIRYGVEAYRSQQIRVVLNWFEELKRLVLTDN